MLSVFHGTRNQLKRFGGGIAAIRIPGHIVAFNSLKDMAQIFSIRTIGCLHKVQPERLSRLLQKIHQLMHLKERDKRIEQTRKVPSHQSDQRSAAQCHCRRFCGTRWSLRVCLWSWFIHNNPHSVQVLQRLFDMWAHLLPIQPTKPCTKGRNRNRYDLLLLNNVSKILKAGFNILQSTFAAPMPLSWEVDDVFGAGQPPGRVDKHAPWPKLPAFASCGIDPKILRKLVLELERDAPPHDADTIHCVDECFRIRFQDVACFEFHHGFPLRLLNSTSRSRS